MGHLKEHYNIFHLHLYISTILPVLIFVSTFLYKISLIYFWYFSVFLLSSSEQVSFIHSGFDESRGITPRSHSHLWRKKKIVCQSETLPRCTPFNCFRYQQINGHQADTLKPWLYHFMMVKKYIFWFIEYLIAHISPHLIFLIGKYIFSQSNNFILDEENSK